MGVEYPEAQPPLANNPADPGRAVPLGSAAPQRTTIAPPSGHSTATVGPHIPDHELLKKIGGGSYGEVWLARNALGGWRAVKIIYRGSFDHDRPFEREFEGIQKFEPISRAHPSQLNILHVGRNQAEGYFYYVMELADDANAPVSSCKLKVEGEREPSTFNFQPATYAPHTLKLDLYRRTRLPPTECIQIGLALTTALEHLHAHGLVHRDIKPSNIIFVNGVPKLADIGLVATMDKTMSFVGTSGFLPPEGPGTPRGDIYSLGKVLYEIGMGRDRQEFPKLPSDLAETVELPRLIELNAIILKACHHDPRQRYQSGREMAAELALLQNGRSVCRKHVLERCWVMLKKFGPVAGGVVLLMASPLLVNLLKHEKTADPETERLYLQGQFLLSRLTDESVGNAISNFNQAIKIDPQFVPAYISLFESYCWNPGGISDKEQSQKVKEIAGKLLSFGPNLAEGHAALAMSKFDEGDWQGAEQEIQRAISLKPNYPLAHGTYGFYCALEGRTAQSHRELQEAQRLDPISRIQATVAGFPFLVERDYDGALAQFRKAVGLDPNFPLAHMWVGITLEAKGDYLEAIAEYEKFDLSAGEARAQVAPDYQALRQAFLANGEKGYWRRALDLALARKTLNDQTMFANELWELPGIYAQLGEKEKALDLLEQDLVAGQLTVWLRVKPCFNSLRDEPRFKELLQKLGHKN
jgi:serine/threonine protein kinase